MWDFSVADLACDTGVGPLSFFKVLEFCAGCFLGECSTRAGGIGHFSFNRLEVCEREFFRGEPGSVSGSGRLFFDMLDFRLGIAIDGMTVENDLTESNDLLAGLTGTGAGNGGGGLGGRSVGLRTKTLRGLGVLVARSSSWYIKRGGDGGDFVGCGA